MNKIKFLGTSGGRFVLINNLRKSGGIWFTLDSTNFLVDPGPGSLQNCLNSRPKLNPKKLDGIILTHRHLDHSNDINLMIEAMSNGGWDKKGVVFAPRDALEEDPVILKYFRKKVNKIVLLKEKGSYNLKNIRFETPIKHRHNVETYGLNIFSKEHSISFITDTKYFDGLESQYKNDILIVNVVMRNCKDHIMHLCVDDLERIVKKNKPKICIMTHFGMTMVKAKPWEIAKETSEKMGVKVIAASDGMSLDIDNY